MTNTINTSQTPIFPRLLRRVRASLIDSVINILIIILWWIVLPYLQLLPGPAKLALPIMLWLVLDPLLVSTTGGTVGHHIMKIKIVDTRSLHRIGLLRALCRSILRTWLGWLSLIFTLCTKNHQALHDLVLRSCVLLTHPEVMPASERRTQQLPDKNYNYPPIWRRTLLVILYLLLWLFAFYIASNLLVSNSCAYNFQCTNPEKALHLMMSLIFWFVAGVILVFGCRGLLPGARRTPITQ